MSPSAEVSKIIGRAMPPTVAACRRSGDRNGGQDNGLMRPLTHHSWTFATYRQVSSFRGRLHLLLRPLSPSVALCRGSMGQNRGSRQFRWEVTRTLNLRFWRPNPACRGVSDAIAIVCSAPRSLSSHAAACRRVSAVTGADSGAAAASAGVLLPAHLTVPVPPGRPPRHLGRSTPSLRPPSGWLAGRAGNTTTCWGHAGGGRSGLLALRHW
jgi:hypothetical protein